MDFTSEKSRSFTEKDYKAFKYDVMCLVETIIDEKYKIEYQAIDAIVSHTLIFLEHLISRGQNIAYSSSANNNLCPSEQVYRVLSSSTTNRNHSSFKSSIKSISGIKNTEGNHSSNPPNATTHEFQSHINSPNLDSSPSIGNLANSKYASSISRRINENSKNNANNNTLGPLLLAEHIIDAMKNDHRKYQRCKKALENYRVIHSMISAFDDTPYINNSSIAFIPSSLSETNPVDINENQGNTNTPEQN